MGHKPDSTQKDKDNKETEEQIEKWKTRRDEWKERRTPCPFGCGKSWKNIHSLSVKRHVLDNVVSGTAKNIF